MKKIKKFVALGLLVCGLVNCSVPSMAKEADCQHPYLEVKERNISHEGHWTTHHDYFDENGKKQTCAVFHYVNTVEKYCSICGVILETMTKETVDHTGCKRKEGPIYY